MPTRRPTLNTILLVQLVTATAFAVAWFTAQPSAKAKVAEQIWSKDAFVSVPVPRQTPLAVAPLYDRPDLVSDEDLAAVLRQVQPKFPRKAMKPNHVEHALRTWGVGAEFRDPAVVSGKEMVEFLTDHEKYVNSWGSKTPSLLQDIQTGITVRHDRADGGSIHHDHWLACLTEAGIGLQTPVFSPGRKNATIAMVLDQALRDFRLDERETEWTTLAFAYWIAPQKEWTGGDGREYSFDLISERLRRGQKELGVCSGTHRVYSLMALIRLDDEFHILSTSERKNAWGYLESVRDRIIDSQFPDGHWPSNWPDGKSAVEKPVVDELRQTLIATGHHIEWLSIAPQELHPPAETTQRAMRWMIDTVKSMPHEKVLENYTFCSHIGKAAAMWRKTSPQKFWEAWEVDHAPVIEAAVVAPASAESTKPVESH